MNTNSILLKKITIRFDCYLMYARISLRIPKSYTISISHYLAMVQNLKLI